MEEKRVTVDELRELMKKSQEFKPFRDKLAELMVRAAKRRFFEEQE